MAFRFNGQTSGDAVAYSHIAALDGIAQFTWSAWIKNGSDTANFYGYALGQSDDSNDGFTWQRVSNDPATVLTVLRNTNPSHWQDAVSGGNLPSPWTDTWHSIVGVFDGTQGTAANRYKVYIDGALHTWAAGDNTFPTTLGTCTDVFVLGFRAGGALDSHWPGDLAEIGIWTDVADATRIADLAAGKAPSFYQTNLLVYIPLISDAVDVKGNAGTPTVTGTSIVDHPSGITYPATTETVPAKGSFAEVDRLWTFTSSGVGTPIEGIGVRSWTFYVNWAPGSTGTVEMQTAINLASTQGAVVGSSQVVTSSAGTARVLQFSGPFTAIWPRVVTMTGGSSGTITVRGMGN